MSAPLVLTTSKICPFAHRAWLAASIKNVPITLDEVSLTNKEAHFTEVYQKAIGHTPSSDGKVPVLSHGDFVITESDVVAEYIDAAFPDSAPHLVPQDAALRARLRIFASQCVTPVFMAWYGVARAYKANKGKTDAEAEAARTAAKDNLTAAFKALESQIEGPFVLGNQITLADILVYPWFERLAVPEHYAQYEFPAQELTKLAQWRATVAALDGVKAIAQPGDYFVTSYASYYGEQ